MPINISIMNIFFNTSNINTLLSLGYMVDAATNLEEGSIASQECVDEYRKELIDQNIGTYQVSIPRTVKKIGNM